MCEWNLKAPWMGGWCFCAYYLLLWRVGTGVISSTNETKRKTTWKISHTKLHTHTNNLCSSFFKTVSMFLLPCCSETRPGKAAAESTAFFSSSLAKRGAEEEECSGDWVRVVRPTVTPSGLFDNGDEWDGMNGMPALLHRFQKYTRFFIT